MKKIVAFSIGMIVILMIVNIIIGLNKYSVGTCAYENCPRETTYGHTYCRTHKCDNLTCDNKKPYGGSYCSECIEKGKNK